MIGPDRRARQEKLYGIVLDDLFVVAVCGDQRSLVAELNKSAKKFLFGFEKYQVVESISRDGIL